MNGPEIGGKGNIGTMLVGTVYARKGFSLLEILVALVLLSLAAVLLFQLFSRSSRNISVSEDYVAAALVAESSMRKVLDADDLQEGTLSEAKDSRYKVESRIAEVLKDRTENLQFKVLEVDMAVKWPVGSKEKVIRLRTLKLIDKTRLKGNAASGVPATR